MELRVNAALVRDEYRRLRRLGWRAELAYAAARTYGEFKALWYLDLVDFEVVDDLTGGSIDDLSGDCFDPRANPDIHPKKLAEQRAEFVERVNRMGVYGIVSRWRASVEGDWEEAYSCYGFVGDDWRDSGYDDDARRAAVNAVQSNLEVLPECGLV